MASSLLDRCYQVESYLHKKQAEKILLAKALLGADERRKLEYAVQYLEAELRMHQEVRTLWPYLLAIPDNPATALFCQLYQSDLPALGQAIEEKIEQLGNSLDVIRTKMLDAGEASPFWRSMRQELLRRIELEARQTIGWRME